MAQKVAMPMDKQSLERKTQETIARIRAERSKTDVYADLNQEALVRNMREKNVEGVKQAKGQVKSLDDALQRHQAYAQTLGELSAGMSTELNQFVEFVQQFGNYKGMEKFWKVVKLDDKANAQRARRLEREKPEELLDLVTKYAYAIVEELLNEREKTKVHYVELRDASRMMADNVAEFGPQAIEMREIVNAKQAAYDAFNTNYQQAAEEERPALVRELDALAEELSELKAERDRVNTIYKEAQEMLEVNSRARDGFDELQRNLGQQAMQVREMIRNAEKLYRATPQAQRVVYRTKGTEIMANTMRKTTQESIDTIMASVEAVSEATLQQRETRHVTEEQELEVLQRFSELDKMIRDRTAAIESETGKSLYERHGENLPPEYKSS